MEIITVNPSLLVEFKTINYGEIFKYTGSLYVKTGNNTDAYGNDDWNCYHIGLDAGTCCIEDYELVLPVKKLTVEY